MSKNASHTPSFIIVITCHKSGSALLHAFLFFLENNTCGIPNRTAIIQDWVHQSFISCLFYLLGARISVSPQESKGSVSLSADISFPSQITCTCNCYSKVFNAFNVFNVSSLQGISSMDLLDPFSCQLHHIAFDRLKSHTPLPCPGSQSINIPLKFHCVYFILNFTIANTVISKKSLTHLPSYECFHCS